MLDLRFTRYKAMISNPQARVWQSVPATVAPLPNTTCSVPIAIGTSGCFFAKPGLQYDHDYATSGFQQIQLTCRKFAV